MSTRKSHIHAGPRRRNGRIGENDRRDTLLFNGYGEEVAHLYEGMDLRKDF